MLALHWPSGPWPLDAGLWTLVPSDAGCHRHWSLRRSSFSARDGARNPLDQPPIIQQPIRRIVQTTIKCSSMKFRSPRLSKHRGRRHRANQRNSERRLQATTIDLAKIKPVKADGIRPSDIAKTLTIGRASVYRALVEQLALRVL
jgi:hypothetical protein